jgi:hypothetical protein
MEIDRTILEGNKTFLYYDVDNGETIIATDKVVGGIKKNILNL